MYFDCHLQPSTIIADYHDTWLSVLYHAMPRESVVKARKRLCIHAQIYLDVGQFSELGVPYAAPVSPEPACRSSCDGAARRVSLPDTEMPRKLLSMGIP